ncbi:NAD(P)/FAD-dependent oxidoreductase [Paraburkholderia sp. HD33-4]|uniref:NAD(P)/FAD-dependent oxidoreductase n=1 Tax=Paraburkholderia sp. HD33-4 TaxID=2883242 RepID=UPI001F36E263|nr:NAD(P)/FAD-dependent oxidoreductase [Paraburkholderia sp. HD33-4]
MNSTMHCDGDAPKQDTRTNDSFDVIVIGAGLAGCTAARLFALQGLRVALVEHHADMASFKQLCTHFIQASATPTLRRLGLDKLIEDAGGVRNGVDIWTRYGWTGDIAPLDASGQPVFGYNIQRRTLDPILRQLAADTPGVTTLLGYSLRALARRVNASWGVELAGATRRVISAQLIVGADGRNSPLAELAGVKSASSDNCRFGAIRAYRNVSLRRGTCSQMWLRGPETAYVFPNDGGVTVIAYMTTKDKLDDFRGDPSEALERNMATFPDAPDLSDAERLGNALLVKDYPNVWRQPTVGNIALIGDALMSIDPLWGVGCGFAFQTAEWLVDTLVPDLKRHVPIAAALHRYARHVSRELNGHRFLILDFARRHGLNAVEKLTFCAAARDPAASRHLHAFGARLIGPSRFLSPRALLHATWVDLLRPAARTAQPDAPV